MPEAHAFTGLFAGDYFIHRFDFDGHITFAYGLVRRIEAEGGKFHADYQCQRPPTQEESIDGADHQVVGRINRSAYKLAKLRGWPNTEAGMATIVDYAAGVPVRLSTFERLQLIFSH